MAALKEGIEIIQQFIALGKELAKLPALVLPQYQPAAIDLYEICKKILGANENMARWLLRFRYFDFQSPNARSEFMNAVREYGALKTGASFKQLKFSCSDIAQIYYKNISSKLGSWFSDSQKFEEAAGIFAKLTDADRDMVSFAQEAILDNLDSFINKVERQVDAGNLNEAEELRLQFKNDTGVVVQFLENFGDNLSELVLEFARVARVPVTL